MIHVPVGDARGKGFGIAICDLKHPDATIASTATAAIPERMPNSLPLHAAAAASIAEPAGQQQDYDDD
jgi:hypothetical protein